jgi:23S rRNA pseudouridine2605 synthase
LLILTNDGDLGLRLTHPRFKIEKEYEVLLDRPFDAAADKPRLLRGVNVEGGRAKAEAVRQLSPVLLRIVLRQGLKRQIRLMLYKLGYEVKRLIRMRIGSLRLTELRAGEWRALTAAEVKGLQNEEVRASKVTAREEGNSKFEIRNSKGENERKGEVRAGKREGAMAGGEGTKGTKARIPGRSAKPAGEREASRRRGARGGASARTGFSGKGRAASAPRPGRRP